VDLHWSVVKTLKAPLLPLGHFEAMVKVAPRFAHWATIPQSLERELGGQSRVCVPVVG
jgi:hypothetical protein